MLGKSISIFSIFTFRWLYAGNAGTQNTGTNTVHIVLVLCWFCAVNVGEREECGIVQLTVNKKQVGPNKKYWRFSPYLTIIILS